MASFKYGEWRPLAPLFEPFIEKFWPGLSKPAANAFVAVISDWIAEIQVHKIGFAADDLSNIGESAISLHRQLTALQELESKVRAAFNDGDQGRAILEELRATCPRDLLLGRIYLLMYVEQGLQSGTPPLLGIDDLCSVLSKIIEKVKGLQVAKRAPGKPLGIKNYPGLDFLVYGLGLWAENHLPEPFTAYVKRAGEAKVAVGSLIKTLNWLREYLVNDQVVKKRLGSLASSLPTASEHASCVSTYQRCLRAAWEEVEKASATGAP
jgi:hypothetical protein